MNTSLLAALVMAVAGPPPEASDGGPPAPLTVDATGDCPSGRAVAAALWPVVGGDARHLLPEAPRVTDLGDSFEITPTRPPGYDRPWARATVQGSDAPDPTRAPSAAAPARDATPRDEDLDAGD